MKTIELNPNDVVINEAIATRMMGQDPSDIERIAKSYEQRHGAGMEPQIMDGVVRNVDGSYELIDGLGRLSAIKLINDAGGLDGEPMKFRVQVVRAKDDEAAIISGIQANFHAEVDPFSRADSMSKLVALGKSQKEVASIFNVHPATVTQTLKLVDVPKKFRKAYTDGDLDQEALMYIAGLEADDSKRQEIIENAIKSRQRFNEIVAKVEHSQKKAEVVSKIEEAKARVEEIKAQAKEAEKAAKAADAALSKAKDEAETKALRAAKVEADKAKKVAGKAWADAEKALIKAKDEKEKIAAQAPTAKKSKVTAEDIKASAKEKGVKKKGGKKIEATPRSKTQLVVFLTSIFEDESKFSEAAKTLATHLVEYLDGEATDLDVSTKFKTCCKTDDQYK